MDEKHQGSRRGFLKATASASALGIGGSVLADRVSANDKTTLTITENGNSTTKYTVTVSTTDLQGTSMESADNIYRYPDTSQAVGTVSSATDTYTFSGQVLSLTAKHKSGGDTRTVFSMNGGFGYTGKAQINVSGDGFYKYTVTDGNISAPGDGSLESDDTIIRSNHYAEGYLSGGHDHYNMKGRLDYVKLQPSGSDTMRFIRSIGSWY